MNERLKELIQREWKSENEITEDDIFELVFAERSKRSIEMSSGVYDALMVKRSGYIYQGRVSDWAIWFPNENEWCECCDKAMEEMATKGGISHGTKTFVYHIKSIVHFACKYGLDLEKFREYQKKTVHKTREEKYKGFYKNGFFYKILVLSANGNFHSLFRDNGSQYKMHRIKTSEIDEDGTGGLNVFRSVEDVLRSAKYIEGKRQVVIKCVCSEPVKVFGKRFVVEHLAPLEMLGPIDWDKVREIKEEDAESETMYMNGMKLNRKS